MNRTSEKRVKLADGMISRATQKARSVSGNNPPKSPQTKNPLTHVMKKMKAANHPKGAKRRRTKVTRAYTKTTSIMPTATPRQYSRLSDLWPRARGLPTVRGATRAPKSKKRR